MHELKEKNRIFAKQNPGNSHTIIIKTLAYETFHQSLRTCRPILFLRPVWLCADIRFLESDYQESTFDKAGEG